MSQSLCARYVFVVGFLTFGCFSSGRGSDKHTRLYLLSMLPYPDPERPSLNPFIADGPDLFPAVQLAVDHVNNRSDVLRDYHIELIETDGGCDISSKALISLVSQLFHSDNKQIVGPSCSESAEAVGAISRRSEIALLSFHHGSSSPLADRANYSYSIGMALSPTDEVTAYIDLMKEAKWTRVAAVYNIDVLSDLTQFQEFKKQAKAAGIEIVYSEVASIKSIPFKSLQKSYARVVIGFVRDELTARILCVAYHNNLIYPNYQWILVNDNIEFLGEFRFYHELENRKYICTERQMEDARTSKVLIEYSRTGHAATDFGLGLSEQDFSENITSLAYDSVWAMALALNGSLETLQEKNMSLTNYTYGQSNATEVILEHLYQLEFLGVSGLISFNEQTGFLKHEANFYFSEEAISDRFYVLTSGVAIGLAVVFLLVIVVTSVLVAFVHVLNTVYENYKSIKASSSRLNHFAYAGCYCFLLAPP